jgi:hypothetical protein
MVLLQDGVVTTDLGSSLRGEDFGKYAGIMRDNAIWNMTPGNLTATASRASIPALQL